MNTKKLLAPIIITTILLTACTTDTEQETETTTETTIPSSEIPHTITNETEDNTYSYNINDNIYLPNNITPNTVTNIRTYNLETYDRVIIDVEGTQQPGYVVKYDQDPHDIETHQKITQPKDTKTLIIFVQQTTPSILDKTPKQTQHLETVNEITHVGTAEKETQILLQLPEKHNFRVSHMENPTRILIDIQH